MNTKNNKEHDTDAAEHAAETNAATALAESAAPPAVPAPAAEAAAPPASAPITDADGAFSPEWYTRFEELQPYAATLAKFRRPEALAKSYANLERLRGYPGSPDSPRMAAFRQAVGLPATPQEFALTRPADTPDEIWDDSLAASLAQVAYEHGVPAPAMSALCEHYAQEGRLAMQAAQLAQQEAVQQAETELRQDWGSRFEANMNTVGNVLRTLGFRAGVDVGALMDNPALRADADFARLMLAAASMVEEAPMHSGAPMDSQGEAHRIAHDPTHPLHEAYMRTSHPRHKYANEMYDRLAFGR